MKPDNEQLIKGYQRVNLQRRMEVNKLKQENDTLSKRNEALWRIINENDIVIDIDGNVID